MIELRAAPRLIMAVCYCKPAPDGGALDRTLKLLRLAMTRLPHHCFIVVGDFSLPDIRWSLSPHHQGRARAEVIRASRRATSFLDACELKGLVQKFSQPTHGDSTLDLVMTS